MCICVAAIIAAVANRNDIDIDMTHKFDNIKLQNQYHSLIPSLPAFLL